MEISDQVKNESVLQSLNAWMRRYLLKAQRAKEFNDTRSQVENFKKAIKFEQKIKYLGNKQQTKKTAR